MDIDNLREKWFSKIDKAIIDRENSEDDEYRANLMGVITTLEEVLSDTSDGNKVNSKIANCAIFDVSQQSELLKAFYAYIDDKWALGMLTDKVDEVIEGFDKSL